MITNIIVLSGSVLAGTKHWENVVSTSLQRIDVDPTLNKRRGGINDLIKHVSLLILVHVRLLFCPNLLHAILLLKSIGLDIIITKTCLFKYTENFTVKNKIFR